MSKDLNPMMPKEMAAAANLLAHPLAGAAAMSALGIGFASHAFGVWMGTLSGAAEMSHRLLQPIFDEFPGGAESFAEAPKAPTSKTPATKAHAATKNLIAEAQSFAKGMTDAAKAADRVADEGAAEAIIAAVAAIPAFAETSTDLMSEDFRQPKAMRRPEMPDDLKAISGVGPKLEQVLNGLGIWTFGQIAGWTREEIAWADDSLGFKGRIGRDDWIGQAAKLAVADKVTGR